MRTDGPLYVSALLVFLYGHRGAGPHTIVFGNACAALCYAIFLWVALGSARSSWPAVLFAIVGGVAFLAAPLTLRSLVLSIALSAARYGPPTAVGRALAGLRVAFLLFGLLDLLRVTSPVLWHYEDAWSATMSRLASSLTGSPFVLGPTPTGVALTLFAMIVVLAIVPPPRFVDAAKLLVGVVLVQLLFLCVSPYLLPVLATLPRSTSVAAPTPASCTPLLAFFLGLFLAAAVPRAPGATEVARPCSWPPRLCFALLLICALGVVASYAAAGRTIGDCGGRRPVVWIHDTGQIDDKVPGFSEFGPRSTGRFGLLTSFLEGIGCVVERCDFREISNFDRANVLVLVNVYEMLPSSTVEGIHRFVERGGGVLALGEHTGYHGIREPLNAVLGSYGIDVDFDSAVPLRSSWEATRVHQVHPLTWMAREERDTQIWVGASLAVRSPAYPIVFGRTAFSDPGSRANAARGYLGNLRYDADERLGDLVLAAAAEPNRGRVLAFGDTSTVQNMALGCSWAFTTRCVYWLAYGSRDRLSVFAISWITGALAVALVLSIPAFGSASCRTLILVGTAVIAGALATDVVGCLRDPLRRPRDFQRMQAMALIDTGHRSRASWGHWDKEALGGLQANLFRNGYYAFYDDARISGASLQHCALYACAAPMSEFNGEELAALDVSLRAGGVALLAIGQPEAQRSTRLLEFLAARVDSRPLGSAAIESDFGRARTHSAFPVVVEREHRPILRQYGYTVMAWIRHGEGGILLVGDSEFFHNRNLEHDSGYIEENIMFLRGCLEYLKRDVSRSGVREPGR